MKNILFLFAFIFCFQAYSQRKPKIKGNRDVVSVEESLPPFNTIELNDELEIMLQKASDEGYAIEADDNLIDVLKFEVEDSTLVISSFYRITGKKKLKVTVNYNHLDALVVRAGDIQMKDAIISDMLTVHTYESAKLQLNAEADLIELVMEGNSSGDYVLTGEEMKFVLKDRIDARIFTDSNINHIEMHKNAGVSMEGNVDSLKVSLTENSTLKGRRQISQNAIVTLQESSSATVNVVGNLKLTSSGSSKTYLYGDGKIEIIEFLDTSELHKEK